MDIPSAFWYYNMSLASIAQLVEHLICNHEVIGSTPIAGSSLKTPETIVGSIQIYYARKAEKTVVVTVEMG